MKDANYRQKFIIQVLDAWLNRNADENISVTMDEMGIFILPPPIIPQSLIAEFDTDLPAIYRACPRIAALYMPENHQRKGVFTDIVSELLERPTTRAIMFGPVCNDSFIEYLQQHPNWHEVVDPWENKEGRASGPLYIRFVQKSC
ncbi:hypothetical protein [Alteromonas sp. ASW11-130]|uniref:hypothetical protein n=1 Tax=Alteromonas sp. ASW11-130 TaxID=3015775 RepID=UPI0022420BEC|nr:hypothetical protein [Alteromonas sp. ASW11-130]MCW8093386.1 hypothetical protein [Alteromonas sp. ASW11-130]